MTNQLDVKNENGNTTLIFDKGFLDKILPEAEKYSDKKLIEAGYKQTDEADQSKFGCGYQLEFNAAVEDIDIDPDRIHLTLQTPGEEVYMNISVPIKPDQVEQMIEVIIKKLNQFRAAIQAVKK